MIEPLLPSTIHDNSGRAGVAEKDLVFPALIRLPAIRREQPLHVLRYLWIRATILCDLVTITAVQYKGGRLYVAEESESIIVAELRTKTQTEGEFGTADDCAVRRAIRTKIFDGR